jgi:hypothetical protein
MSANQTYVKEVIASIRNPLLVGMSKILMEAALLLEKFHDTGGWEGLSSCVDDTIVTAELAAELRSVLLDFVERCSDHPDVGIAIFALTRCGDSRLRPFFLRQMRRYCEAGLYHPMSQAEYGLTTLGDGVGYDYAPGQTDHSGYFAAVRDYLERRRDEIAT